MFTRNADSSGAKNVRLVEAPFHFRRRILFNPDPDGILLFMYFSPQFHPGAPTKYLQKRSNFQRASIRSETLFVIPFFPPLFDSQPGNLIEIQRHDVYSIR